MAEWNGLSYAEPMTDGQDNVKFDWVIPAQADLELADRLIEEARGASECKAHTAAVALLLRSAELGLDPERRAAIDELTATVAADFTQAKIRVLAAIESGDASALKAALREEGKAFRGSLAADWFEQAALLGRATAGVQGLEAAATAGPVDEGQRSQLREKLLAAAAMMDFSDLKAGSAALLARVDTAAGD